MQIVTDNDFKHHSFLALPTRKIVQFWNYHQWSGSDES